LVQCGYSVDVNGENCAIAYTPSQTEPEDLENGDNGTSINTYRDDKKGTRILKKKR
jgi:hypothetical protein